MKLDRRGTFGSNDKVAARRPKCGFDAVVEEVRVSFASDLCANSVDEGVEESVTMVELQG